MVVARGRPKTGTQPSNYSQFISKIEFYNNIKLWNSTITYPVGSFVSFGANAGGWPQRYQAGIENTDSEHPSANWDEITVGDFIGDLQYSPFTIDKATPILNGFANPTGDFDTTSLDAVAIPDHNLVINDVLGSGDNKIGTYRNWAVFRAFSPQQDDLTTAQKAYLFPVGTSTNFGYYDGFTVLVDPELGTLQAPFDESDSNGIPFKNNLAIFKATPGFPVFVAGSTFGGEWFVVRVTEDFDQCAVYSIFLGLGP